MLLKNLEDIELHSVVGDWAFIKNDTWVAIRYDKNPAGVIIIPVADEMRPNWQWNGNKESPTLIPSILITDVPGVMPGWHGFLTNGKLITV